MKMFIKRGVVIGLLLVVALVGVLAACAAPTSTTTTTPTPTITPTSAPVSGPLAQIIEGAKKEGTVSVKLAPSTLTPKSMERLAREIKERFGVDLHISFAPVTSMTRDVAEAIMEYNLGAPPTYDLMVGAPNHVVKANDAGVLEQVDWKPLITPDMNPAAVIAHPLLHNGLVYYTSTIGVLYNPEKVPAPETISDMANPKWKGKISILDVPSHWVRRSFVMGKEKALADLRAIKRNGALVATYAGQLNRFLLGEVWMCKITSSYWWEAKQKGMPAAFISPDYAETSDFCIVMRKGALHPNAAKLVAIYIATPAGATFMLEEGGSPNILYPGNYESDILAQNQKRGIPSFATEGYPGLLEFIISDEAAQLEKEITLILQGQ